MTTSPVPSITDELLDELQQKAKAATPGPWGTWGEAFVAPLRARDGGEYSVVECERTIAEVRGANDYANWRFIATANPSTILALVEHIRSLTERLHEARAWISVDDHLPHVAEGDEQEVIVCVQRAHNGKSYSFASRYLNKYPLYSEDAEADEDGILQVTGWYEAEAHAEYHTWFSPLIIAQSGDEITHWMPLPAVPAIAQEGADHE